MRKVNLSFTQQLSVEYCLCFPHGLELTKLILTLLLSCKRTLQIVQFNNKNLPVSKTLAEFMNDGLNEISSKKSTFTHT